MLFGDGAPHAASQAAHEAVRQLRPGGMPTTASSISAPRPFASIDELWSRLRAAWAQRSEGVELADVLEEINALLDQGLISAEEFRVLLGRGRRVAAASKRAGASASRAVGGSTRQAPSPAVQSRQQPQPSSARQPAAAGLNSERRSMAREPAAQARSETRASRAESITKSMAAAQREEILSYLGSASEAAEEAAGEAAERAWNERAHEGELEELEELVPIGVPWGSTGARGEREGQEEAEEAKAATGRRAPASEQTVEEWVEMRRYVVGEEGWRAPGNELIGRAGAAPDAAMGEDEASGGGEMDAVRKALAAREAEEEAAWKVAEETVARREAEALAAAAAEVAVAAAAAEEAVAVAGVEGVEEEKAEEAEEEDVAEEEDEAAGAAAAAAKRAVEEREGSALMALQQLVTAGGIKALQKAIAAAEGHVSTLPSL